MPNKNDCCILKCLIRAGAPKAAIKKYINKCNPKDNGDNATPGGEQILTAL